MAYDRLSQVAEDALELGKGSLHSISSWAVASGRHSSWGGRGGVAILCGHLGRAQAGALVLGNKWPDQALGFRLKILECKGGLGCKRHMQIWTGLTQIHSAPSEIVGKGRPGVNCTSIVFCANICPPVHPSIYSSFYPLIYPPTHPRIHHSVCLSIHLSIHPSLDPLVHPSVCPSIRLAVGVLSASRHPPCSWRLQGCTSEP